ncbi:MAG: hypothetical protein GXO97_09950 [Nitrospirae bacterium]|nr:hypothetical protein [Nitrospirota bacterium]
MIKEPRVFEEWEKGWKEKEGPLPFNSALKIVEALWQEGMRMGTLPPSDPLEGIETDIRIARILNRCLRNSSEK